MTKQTQNQGWNFDNSYARLPEFFFTKQEPTPVKAPKIIVFNSQLAEELGLNPTELEADAEVFSGNELPIGANPIAQAYAGHQFGHLAMLGDGRAILLGEQLSPSGERFDIQLKGSGRTPYSRGGDGRAALGPMLREHIISEAMHALGIPTTRSLAVVATGEAVYRENELPGAILTRVAASHLRVGTFTYTAGAGEKDEIRTLADYAIERHYPDLNHDVNKYLDFFRAVIDRQAALIAQWQLVGFIHGVMNTDNMTISGETIDYGPCAFMDIYDPATVFSSIDREGRYAYGNQPYIGGWNLARLAEALLPLFHDDTEKAVDIAQEEIAGYIKLHHSYWIDGMRKKLGLFNVEEEDEKLVDELLGMMKNYRADYTNTFRALTFGKTDETVLKGYPDFTEWLERWEARRRRQEQTREESHQLMRNSNPAIIPRNHRVEEALEAAVEEEDFSVMERLLIALSNPFAHSPEQEKYCKLAPASSQPYRTFCGT
ncbi:hypothetical protein AM500_22490 [Bacillus sp. FJAT-18017]|uniref:protein adenylyltransferase SelO n=1 Tax=Bacillus sp. FJAT-18017 TaxID=1705566 RepID=UPI0006AFC376|nr:YdiU family protein [Bacillus sp. FJAT-18017]ALC92231.1 hypothetical protein AM500_22490 [Bacillus sp. FJAT-18017]